MAAIYIEPPVDEAATERQRLRRQVELRRATLAGACARLARTIEPEGCGGSRAPLFALGGVDDDALPDEPLLAVCRLVRGESGIPVILETSSGDFPSYELARNMYKPYPCGLVIHAVIDG